MNCWDATLAKYMLHRKEEENPIGNICYLYCKHYTGNMQAQSSREGWLNKIKGGRQQIIPLIDFK